MEARLAEQQLEEYGDDPSYDDREEPLRLVYDAEAAQSIGARNARLVISVEEVHWLGRRPD